MCRFYFGTDPEFKLSRVARESNKFIATEQVPEILTGTRKSA